MTWQPLAANEGMAALRLYGCVKDCHDLEPQLAHSARLPPPFLPPPPGPLISLIQASTSPPPALPLLTRMIPPTSPTSHLPPFSPAFLSLTLFATLDDAGDTWRSENRPFGHSWRASSCCNCGQVRMEQAARGFSRVRTRLLL